MNKPNNDLSQKYSKGIIITHWLTTVLILILFPMGKYMEGLIMSEKLGLIKTHAILGFAVLILSIIRTFSFFKNTAPEPIKTGSTFNDQMVIWIHRFFYILLFGLAITGIITMIMGGYTEVLNTSMIDHVKPKNEISSLKAHGLLSIIMMLLLLLHIAGIIKHYLKTNENVLKRILPK